MIKRLIAFAALVTLTAAAAWHPTDTQAVTRAAYCPAVNGLPGHYDNGSGCLDTLWPTRAHGQYGNVSGADVLLVGDSITTLCKTSLLTRLQANNLTWGVNYWSGRPTQYAVDLVLSHSVKPKVVVMATGTNDIYNTPVMAAQTQRLVTGLAAHGTRILWVDVRAERPAYAVADMNNSRAVNSQIWANPGVTGVHWIKWFDDQPSRKALYIKPDGVHPNEPGCEFWGSAIAPSVIGAAKAAKLRASVPR
jgi:hypothetical protein